MIANTDLVSQVTITVSRGEKKGPHILPGVNLLTTLLEISQLLNYLGGPLSCQDCTDV